MDDIETGPGRLQQFEDSEQVTMYFVRKQISIIVIISREDLIRIQEESPDGIDTHRIQFIDIAS